MATFKKFRFKLGKITSDSIVHNNKLLSDMLSDDSGWLDLQLASGVTEGLYFGPPQYRKIGNQVFLKGSVAFMPSANKVICILPAECIPNLEVTFASMPGNSKVARMGIKEDGLVCHSCYDISTGKSSNTDITYLDINYSYLID